MSDRASKPSARAAGSPPPRPRRAGSGSPPSANGRSSPLGRPERKAPERQPPQPLVPADAVAVEVAALDVSVAPVGAADDLQLLGEREPVLRVDVGEAAARPPGASPAAADPAAPSGLVRQREQELDRLEDARLAARRADRRSCAGRSEASWNTARASGREVGAEAGGTMTAKSLNRSGAPGSPRRSRSSSRRTSVQISAAIVSSSRRGSGAGSTIRLPSAPGRSAPAGARSRTSCCSVREQRRARPAAGSAKRDEKSQSVSWFSSRMLSRPGRPQRASSGFSASPGGRQPALRARHRARPRTPTSAARAARRRGNRRASRPPPALRLEVFPELAAGVEGVDVDVAPPRQRGEDRPVEPGHVRDPEHVRPESPPSAARGRSRSKKLGQRPRPRRRRAVPRGRTAPATAPAASAAAAGSAAGSSAPRAPGRQHLGAREGVGVEQVGQLPGQLDPPPVAPLGRRRRQRPNGRPNGRRDRRAPAPARRRRPTSVADRGTGRGARPRSCRGRRSGCRARSAGRRPSGSPRG